MTVDRQISQRLRCGLGSRVLQDAEEVTGGVQSIDLSETVATEAARIQYELRTDGEEMSVRDLLVAATARSTGAELVVADADFQTDLLTEYLTVTNLRE